jgi:hypothetical protein
MSDAQIAIEVDRILAEFLEAFQWKALERKAEKAARALVAEAAALEKKRHERVAVTLDAYSEEMKKWDQLTQKERSNLLSNVEATTTLVLTIQ